MMMDAVSLVLPPSSETAYQQASMTIRSLSKKKASRPKRKPPARRVREQQHLQEQGLIMDVNELKQEIADIRKRQALIQAKSLLTHQPMYNSCIRTVEEYYQHFARGVRFTNEMEEKNSLVPLPNSISTEFHYQLEFFDRIFDSDCRLRFHSTQQQLNNKQLLFEQLRRFNEYFAWQKITLLHVESIVTPDSRRIHAKSIASGVCTRKTIEKLFPNAKNIPSLFQRMIGKTLRIPSEASIEFNERGQINCYMTKPEYVAGLLELLGDLESVILALQGTDFSGLLGERNRPYLLE